MIWGERRPSGKIYRASFESKVALAAIQGDQTVAELAARSQIHPFMVTKWKKQLADGFSQPQTDKNHRAIC